MSDNKDIKDLIPENALERQLYYIEKCKEYVKKVSEELGRPLKCCVNTFGCRSVSVNKTMQPSIYAGSLISKKRVLYIFIQYTLNFFTQNYVLSH